MQPKWHIAFCNVTFTEYAGVSYRDYYGSPAVMLEAQLAAQAVAEERWGVGRFIRPHIDSPPCTFASFLGAPVVEPQEDELPYVDPARPLLTDVRQGAKLRAGDPRRDGWMARRWEAREYYQAHGYPSRLGGYDGGIITTACELSSGNALAWLAEDPDAAERMLDALVAATETLATFDASLSGGTYAGLAYVGDDFSGLLSPAMFRRFAVPCYQRLYAGQERRFMHSELLRAEHLRIARDEVGITEFHGAGCKNLTVQQMQEIMGSAFWTQVTPQELQELTPRALTELIKTYAGSGCSYVQLYPGRGVPPQNMDAAIAAVQRECPGGPAW
jgi:hypothetical protein